MQDIDSSLTGGRSSSLVVEIRVHVDVDVDVDGVFGFECGRVVGGECVKVKKKGFAPSAEFYSAIFHGSVKHCKWACASTFETKK